MFLSFCIIIFGYLRILIKAFSRGKATVFEDFLYMGIFSMHAGWTRRVRAEFGMQWKCGVFRSFMVGGKGEESICQHRPTISDGKRNPLLPPSWLTAFTKYPIPSSVSPTAEGNTRGVGGSSTVISFFWHRIWHVEYLRWRPWDVYARNVSTLSNAGNDCLLLYYYVSNPV